MWINILEHSLADCEAALAVDTQRRTNLFVFKVVPPLIVLTHYKSLIFKNVFFDGKAQNAKTETLYCKSIFEIELDK